MIGLQKLEPKLKKKELSPTYEDKEYVKIRDLCTAAHGIQEFDEWKIHQIGSIGIYKPEPFDYVRMHTKLPFMKKYRDMCGHNDIIKYWNSCTEMKIGNAICKYMGEGLDFIIVQPMGYSVQDIYASAVLAHASEKTLEEKPEMNFVTYLRSIKDVE